MRLAHGCRHHSLLPPPPVFKLPTTIAIATVLPGQLDDVLGQALFVRPATRHLALRGAVLPQGAAGAAFRYAERLPHVVDASAAT